MKLLFLLFVLSLTSAQSKTKALLTADLYDAAPWGYLDNGKITGISSEFYKRFITETGIKVDQQLVPFKRTISRVTKGSTDLFIFIKQDWVNDIAINLGTIAQSRTEIILKEGFKIKTLSGLNNKTICVAHGMDLKQVLPKKINFKRYDGRSDFNCLKMLKSKRVDASVVDSTALPFFLKKLEMESIHKDRRKELIVKPIALYMSNVSKNKHLVPRIKKHIPALRKYYSQVFDSKLK